MFNILRKLFLADTTSSETQNEPTVNYLIVGLGNIGKDYENTRHNIGFDVVDLLAEQREVNFNLDRHAFYTHFKFKGRTFHMIKPTTYMNLSGKALKHWQTKLKVKQENILVVVDDIALPFGKIRLKLKGSAGGHNGLKDIEAKLGNQQYARLRFGIGDNYRKGQQVQYVLGQWTSKENEELPIFCEKAAEMVIAFATIGAQRTMSQYNK